MKFKHNRAILINKKDFSVDHPPRTVNAEIYFVYYYSTIVLKFHKQMCVCIYVCVCFCIIFVFSY